MKIQYAPEILRFIKSEIDQHRQTNGQFIMTGSQKFSLMKGVSESLAGRVSIVNLHSLSTREISKHVKSDLSATQILEWLLKR